METILKIEDLMVIFDNESETIAVNNVSLDIRRGETFALAGESGSGKTITALSILNLIEYPGVIKNGKIYYSGQNLLELNDEQLNNIRGREISMIFQEPSSAYDQFFSIGEQFSEIIRKHLNASSVESRRAAIEWLSSIGFHFPNQIYDSYPFQLSGGMQQRAMIAMALCCRPSILIADEPTTSLDAISQAQILTLILDLKKSMDLTILLISHDFGLIAQSADRIAIMYRGRIVEIAPVTILYKSAAHPYTMHLLKSIADFKTGSFPSYANLKLNPPPNALTLKQGCPFYPNCQISLPICKDSFPPPTQTVQDHFVYCWKLT